MKSLVVAVATLALVVCAGFAVQALALGRPTRGTLELVQALARLDAYRRSQAALVVDGRPHTARCEQRWLRHGHEASVVLDGHAVLLEVGHHLLRTGALASVQFDLAACPRSLATWLASQLTHHATTLSAHVDGDRVIEVHLPDARPALDLYVALDTHLPIGLVVRAGRVHGASDVHFGSAS